MNGAASVCCQAVTFGPVLQDLMVLNQYHGITALLTLGWYEVAMGLRVGWITWPPGRPV